MKQQILKIQADLGCNRFFLFYLLSFKIVLKKEYIIFPFLWHTKFFKRKHQTDRFSCRIHTTIYSITIISFIFNSNNLNMEWNASCHSHIYLLDLALRPFPTPIISLLVSNGWRYFYDSPEKMTMMNCSVKGELHLVTGTFLLPVITLSLVNYV